MNVHMQRQFMAGPEQVNTQYRAAVHDPQALFLHRPVCLRRCPVGDSQVIDEHTVTLAVLVGHRVAIVQTGIE